MDQSPFVLLRFNPHHDEKGRFASASGHGGRPAEMKWEGGSGNKPKYGTKYTSIDQVNEGDVVYHPDYTGTVVGKHKHGKNTFIVKDVAGVTHFPSYTTLIYGGNPAFPEKKVEVPKEPVKRKPRVKAPPKEPAPPPAPPAPPTPPSLDGKKYAPGVKPDTLDAVRAVASRDVPPYKKGRSGHFYNEMAKEMYPHIWWSISTMDGELAHTVLSTLHERAREFPEVMARLKVVKTKLPGSEDMSRTAYAHAYMKRGDIMGFNTDYWKDKPRLERSVARSNADKWLARGTPASIVDHEFGHLVDSWYQTNPEVKVGTTGIIGLRRHRGAAEVSRYATTSHAEGFAEAFSMARDPHRTGPLPAYAQAQKDWIASVPKDSRAWSAEPLTWKMPKEA